MANDDVVTHKYSIYDNMIYSDDNMYLALKVLVNFFNT